MIIGHQKIWKLFKESVESGKLSHAYLFAGQEKIGKKTLALELAKLIFGEKTLKEAQGDFIFVAPFQKEIQISQIRDLIWRLSLKPSLAPFKVAIIDQAHCMNQEAQSALLKTLEDPRGHSILILISEYPETLFPTILSRLQTIKFNSPSRENIEYYLRNQNLKDSQINDIKDFCQGKIGLAIDFLKEPQKLEEQKMINKKLTEIIGSPLAIRFQYVKDLVAKQQDFKELLDSYLTFFRKELINRLTNQKEESFLKENYSPSKLKNILWQIQNVNYLLSRTNVNPRLALEKLMVEF